MLAPVAAGSGQVEGPLDGRPTEHGRLLTHAPCVGVSGEHSIFQRRHLDEDVSPADPTLEVATSGTDRRFELQIRGDGCQHRADSDLVHCVNQRRASRSCLRPVNRIPQLLPEAALDLVPRDTARQDFEVALDLPQRNCAGSRGPIRPCLKRAPENRGQAGKPLRNRWDRRLSHWAAAASARANPSPARRRGPRAGAWPRRRACR